MGIGASEARRNQRAIPLEGRTTRQSARASYGRNAPDQGPSVAQSRCTSPASARCCRTHRDPRAHRQSECTDPRAVMHVPHPSSHLGKRVARGCRCISVGPHCVETCAQGVAGHRARLVGIPSADPGCTSHCAGAAMIALRYTSTFLIAFGLLFAWMRERFEACSGPTGPVMSRNSPTPGREDRHARQDR